MGYNKQRVNSMTYTKAIYFFVHVCVARKSFCPLDHVGADIGRANPVNVYISKGELAG